MSESILQKYLSLQFIPIDDESGADKLKKSAYQLEKKLRKERERIPSYVLLALDPNAAATEPIFQEVQDLVIKNWPVYVNKAGGQNLVTYNRAVILEALNTLSADVEIAGIIWLTGIQMIQYGMPGREGETLRDWIVSIGRKFEARSRQLWATDHSEIEVSSPDFPAAPELKTSVVNKDYLIKRMTAAAGPNYINEAGETIATEKGNSHWPNANSNWTSMFGRIAGESLTASINSGLNSVTKEFATYAMQLEESLKGIFEVHNRYFEEVSEKIQIKNRSLDLRSQLLWIKESQYSNSLAASYREIDSVLIPLAIAKDISDIILPVYPVSVDYFAKEVARVSTDSTDDVISLDSFFSSLEKNDRVRSLVPADTLTNGRVSMLSFISGIASKRFVAANFSASTGFPLDLKVSVNDLLVWLLHDIQSIKLSQSK